ncbi:MAG: DUF389 domain-containing protein, partial [Chloroflexota bacterium]
MNYDDKLPPISQPVPDPGQARRRRVTRRSRIPTDPEGQAALIASLAKRAYPSVELFVFSLLCGAVLGLGFMLDSQAVLLLGILLAPLMTPWVGFLLAILTGSIRFLFETLLALLISAGLIFGVGLLTGFASRVFLPLNTTSAIIHSRLWLPELIVLVIGAILLVASFVRSESKPFLPSVVVAYVLFLPLNAAGFGLGSGVEGMWPQGALVTVTHLALASFFGLLTLFALRLRPSVGGLILSLIMGLAFVGILVFLMGPGLGSAFAAREVTTPTSSAALPSPTVSLLSASLDTSTPKASSTPRTLTATRERTLTPVPLTLEITLPPSETPTITLTIEPTPVYGKIASDEGGGVNLRNAPNGKYLATIGNDSIVEVLPGIEEVNGVAWAHVIATKNGRRIEGWILESTLLYPTPIPNWEP